MTEKKFKLSTKEIKQVLKYSGSCIASDKITVEGLSVGYMYREEPLFDTDSGWRFFSGTEDQAYVDNPNNAAIYDLNTIANYDSLIIPFLGLEVGVEIEKNSEGELTVIK